MLRYIEGRDLGQWPRLAESMFSDRARQFRDRLGWKVTVDREGAERDQYDVPHALYVVLQGPDGCHQGSMRFLPTFGSTMLNEVFPHLTGGSPIRSPFIWETTRFCISPRAGTRAAAALMLGGLELGLHFNLSHAVGVFDDRMGRVYRALGWPPAILGEEGGISAGLWAFEADLRPRLLRRAGVSGEASRQWLTRDLGAGLLVAA